MSNQIIAALEACIQALSVTGVDQETVDTALQALITARNIARQEMVEKILGALYLQEYDRDHVLFRITVEDFADLLANHLARARLAPEALEPDELADLLNQASEYLNNEGMPWVEIINLALVDAWPDRIPLPDHER